MTLVTWSYVETPIMTFSSEIFFPHRNSPPGDRGTL